MLTKVSSHLTNTNQILEKLRNLRLGSSCVIVSFDVTSLYTNVQNEQALQALSEMLDGLGRSIETFGLGKARIMTFINECLGCNIFKWSASYYPQIRGLAMGQRLAHVLAICFMSRMEEPILARSPSMYCRCTDDCCIVTSVQSVMDECFRIMNEQSQYIRLTRGILQDGRLSYLNTQIKVFSGYTLSGTEKEARTF
ncbi:unnamed protein product [Haemonchus placei]|uniref:Reverse transcriptase domain-containing protein n=1 Tax=Haemonchus placei TaxID=6290 RepID=A0A0N4VUS1_HAEPC|nr:unnamed protein product [Haemonchus placei]